MAILPYNHESDLEIRSESKGGEGHGASEPTLYSGSAEAGRAFRGGSDGESGRRSVHGIQTPGDPSSGGAGQLPQGRNDELLQFVLHVY